MVYNKIQVAFGALKRITGPTINYQYDVQQILVINGLDLPEYYVVDFCNEGDATDSTGDFSIPPEVVNPNTGAIVAIRGIRDSSGYSGWHGFYYGTPNNDTFGFKALTDTILHWEMLMSIIAFTTYCLIDEGCERH